VESYTCPPSFNGTAYGDFAASCINDSSPTNNLTVRLDGEIDYKRVTGDQGVIGTTVFDDVEAGKYLAYGEKPYNIPLLYLFCGNNPDDPSAAKAINGSIPLDLANGEEVTCEFFLVPEQLTKDTGSILVHKFDCPIENPAKGYDWANECERSATQQVFALGTFNQEMQGFEELTHVQANPDGLVRFPGLAPGTYELTEVDSRWCFAQSNSVNAQGNVVVQANRLAEVWIYNCVGTSQPPNTGAGTAAMPFTPEGTSGTMMLLNLTWPVVALTAWLGWRARHPRPVTIMVRRGGDRAA
jgi:hypothetical protein